MDSPQPRSLGRLSLAVLLTAAACSSPPPEVLGAFSVGPAGAIIELGAEHTADAALRGLLLALPPGAVREPVQIKVELLPAGVNRGPDEQPAGPALRLSPPDLQLQLPATLYLPTYDPAPFTFTDSLVAAAADTRLDLENPLRRIVVRNPRRVAPLQIRTLGDFQALVPRAGGPAMPGRVNKVDILFVVDNSSSMAKKQSVLIGKFKSFIDQILSCDVKVHLGVVSTDTGTVPAGMTTWPKTGDPNCNRNAEMAQAGVLQDKTCIERGLGSDPNCQAACKRGIKPSANYIELDMTKAPAGSNLPGMTVRSDDVTDAFGCLAYLGESGCGIESPLESAKLAVNEKAGPGEPNQRFSQFDPLHPEESLLVLVFVTDEDDASVRMREWSNPDLFTDAMPGATTKDFTNFGNNFRPFAMSTKCTDKVSGGTLLIEKGQKKDCIEDRTSGYLWPLETLRNEIARKVGVDYTRQVLVAGIWPLNPADLDPAQPNYGYRAAFGPGQLPAAVELEYVPRAGGTGSTLLQLKLNPCAKIPGAGSAPQLRLSRFADQIGVLASYQADICDPDEYSGVLAVLAGALKSAMPMKCR